MTVTLAPELEMLVAELSRSAGVVAVVLGGSRAIGTHDTTSDWDIGVYYRGHASFDAIAKRGELHPPGAWGRIMNGGAWLTCDGHKVDVMLRDLDVVDHWTERARRGEFDVDGLLGYLAGVPTYSLAAERAVARVLAGTLPPPDPFPPKLAELAPCRWRFHRTFSLDHARGRAKRGDVVGAVGCAAKAVMEEAHACLCAERTWVLNEKRIVETARLAHVHAMFARPPSDSNGLVSWLDDVTRALDA